MITTRGILVSNSFITVSVSIPDDLNMSIEEAIKMAIDLLEAEK